MISNVEMALKTIVSAIATQEPVRAIGLSSGSRPFPRPGQGDIDLFVYCAQIPSASRRRAVLESMAGMADHIAVGQLEGGHWGIGDSLHLVGIETWLMYFCIGEARDELDALLEGKYPGRADDEYYPMGRCAMWNDMRILYDPEGVLQSFKERLAEYPLKLAAVILSYHLQKLGDTEDLERAVRRGDALFYHFAIDLALDHFLQALFALNRVYFPSRKRSLEYIDRFQVKPADCAQRLLRAMELGGCAETLAQSCAVWMALAQELKALAVGAVGCA